MAIAQTTIIGCIIIILSTIDSLFTLLILDNGGTEKNIFMKLLLEYGEEVFLIVKGLTTTIGVVILDTFSKEKLFGVNIQTIMATILFGYCLLIVYELEILMEIFGK